MADRIFPNTFKEEPLDSDLVFKGIDWDNFNTKLAEVKNSEQSELPEEFREVLAGKNKMPEEVEEMFKKKNVRDDEDADDLSDVPEGLRDHVKKMQEKSKSKKNDDDKEDMDEEKPKSKKKTKKAEKSDECPDCECDPCECDKKESGWGKGSMKKKAFHFTHPSQLTAEAIEAAQASGDEELVKAIVAARHERRVRLASKIEEKVAEEAEVSQKLAQRKAYRESLVNKVVEAESANSKRTASSDGFVKVSNMSNSSKKAFAAKAIAQGFPQEYVEAMLGSDSKPVVDNTKEIRTVMSSDLSLNVKKSAVTSMVREATLSDADYSRLINYWKNELGYGDQEWIDALFTKKYDK
jgi:hypothetical protein